LVFLDPFVCPFQLIKEETRGKDIKALESSSNDEDNEDTDNVDEDSGEDDGDSSSSGDDEGSSDHEESSPKVDITG
jgi:hypothetical protein